MKHLSILYRGPLSSCNYDCWYCPFAKRSESKEELQRDQSALARFVEWAERRTDFELSFLFTPWGEALIRRWYREGLPRLTQLSHVRRVAVQTNLSADLSWVEESRKEKLALWCSYHPEEVSRSRFLDRCLELHERGVRFSVGVVGLSEHEREIRALRDSLPTDVYLWINAFKRDPGYYSADDRQRLQAIDPLFSFNSESHKSRGQECQTGESTISVDGDGTMRRCHFVETPIGNLYDPDFASALKSRTCPKEVCGCHIGYVHMPKLGLYDVFGEGVLERIPEYFSSRQ